MSPSSTADDTGNYGGLGVEGLAFPAGEGLAQCTTFARDPVSWAARLYLSYETMSIG